MRLCNLGKMAQSDGDLKLEIEVGSQRRKNRKVGNRMLRNEFAHSRGNGIICRMAPSATRTVVKDSLVIFDDPFEQRADVREYLLEQIVVKCVVWGVNFDSIQISGQKVHGLTLCVHEVRDTLKVGVR